MVLARVFRGVDAERMALALVKELRNDYNLPAYILRTKDFPGKSLIRGTPPTVPSEVMAPTSRCPRRFEPSTKPPSWSAMKRRWRTQEKLWQQVKKIKPKCLEEMSSPFPWRDGTEPVLRTTNPYVPAQFLFPRTKDRLMVQMNSGLRSIVNCPGRYSLQIAEFSGRSTFQFNALAAAAQHLLPNLKDSPLRKAARRRGKNGRKAGQGPRVPAAGSADLRRITTGRRAGCSSARSTPRKTPGPPRFARSSLRMAVPLVDKSTRARQERPRHHDRSGPGLDRRLIKAKSMN